MIYRHFSHNIHQPFIIMPVHAISKLSLTHTLMNDSNISVIYFLLCSCCCCCCCCHHHRCYCSCLHALKSLSHALTSTLKAFISLPSTACPLFFSETAISHPHGTLLITVSIHYATFFYKLKEHIFFPRHWGYFFQFLAHVFQLRISLLINSISSRNLINCFINFKGCCCFCFQLKINLD